VRFASRKLWRTPREKYFPDTLQSFVDRTAGFMIQYDGTIKSGRCYLMNIQTQCCGIIVLFVLYLFYRRQEKVKLNTEKAYWRAFCITVLSICMDILSIVAIVNMDRLPIHLVNWVCKTYLVSMIGVALSSLLYIYADLYSKNGQYQRFIKKYTRT